MDQHWPLDLSQGGAESVDETTDFVRWPWRSVPKRTASSSRAAIMAAKASGQVPRGAPLARTYNRSPARRLVGQCYGPSQLAAEQGPLSAAWLGRAPTTGGPGPWT